ncbi:MAG: hypothetical protein ACAH95_16105 [Fimbriimonas sp.]
MANREHKILFRWDAVVWGALGLIVILWAVPVCCGLNSGLNGVASRGLNVLFQAIPR